LIAAGITAVLGILLGLSVAHGLFRFTFFLDQPGALFVAAYGALAFVIPAYFLIAALILLDPQYRPDRIFSLSCTIFPFLTLAFGSYVYRNFDHFGALWELLNRMGKNLFEFLVIALTVAEIFGIAGLRVVLFPEFRSHRRGKRPEVENSFRKRPRELLLAPKAEVSSPSREAPIQLEAPASVSKGTDSKGVDVKGPEEPHPPVEFKKPLASAEVFRRLKEAEKSEAFKTPGPETEATEGEGQRKNDGSLRGFTPVPVETFDGMDDVERALEEASMVAELRSQTGGLVSPKIATEESSIHRDADPSDPASGTAGARPSGSHNHGPYHVPVEGILTAYPDGQYWIIDQATRDAAIILKETLNEFNIQAEVTGIRKGPVITMFEILPAPGVKLSKIVNLQDNIALRLAASSVRIVAPIPGKHAVGIEVPNHKRNIVSFREMIEGELHREGKRLEIPVVLGKDITGEAQTLDLVQTPHLLIAGATGSGKSVCVNSMILSILYQRSPAEVRLILIDPKIVELKLYNDIPHLLTPVITEPKRAFQALQYCIFEMERRYALLDSMGVRDIRSYNKRIKERSIATERIPYIVVVIDEFADLMATTGKELESTVARLAAMSRAVGIHLVLATQRPSIDVITGLIKANIPSRIAFMVASKMDSRIIIDMVGAEKLLGKGDLLYAGVVDPFPIRMQGAFVSEEEVEKVVEYVKTLGEPDYIDEEIFYDDEDEEAQPSLFADEDDPLYDKALEIVYQQGKASASFIQRRLKIGYNRAARLVELMEERGIVGPAQGSKPRDILRGQ
jgi:S-DNA-T family DNA segregation ATPase FtsK/SpoIIIE